MSTETLYFGPSSVRRAQVGYKHGQVKQKQEIHGRYIELFRPGPKPRCDMFSDGWFAPFCIFAPPSKDDGSKEYMQRCLVSALATLDSPGQQAGL